MVRFYLAVGKQTLFRESVFLLGKKYTMISICIALAEVMEYASGNDV
jgi:hypothetical protein